MIYENPYPVIETDWDSGKPQWREITPSAYYKLLQATKPLHQSEAGFMQSEPVALLRNGTVAHVCCQQSRGFYFARILPADEWALIPQALPLPIIKL